MTESIRTRTMRRVITVYYLRKVLNRFVLKVGILVLGALSFGSLVHVAAVFNNMPHMTDLYSLSYFSYYAFMNTDIIVQAIIVTAGAVTLWLARDIFREFVQKTQHIPQYSHA